MQEQDDAEKKLLLAQKLFGNDEIDGAAALSDDDKLSDFDEELGAFEEPKSEPTLSSSVPIGRHDSDQQQHENLQRRREDLVLDAPVKQKKLKEKKPRSAVKAVKRQRRQTNNEASEDEDGLQQPQQYKHESLAEFDMAVIQMKSGGSRRKRGLEDEAEADEIIEQLCRQMKQAHAADVEANTEKKPAVNRLKLLQQVTNVMRRENLQEQLLDHEVLECIREWMEPLPDGSLPAINIRRDMLEILQQLPVDDEQIRSSRIGRVVMFYARNAKELPDLRQMATKLIHQWSRPLLQRHQNATAYIEAYAPPVQSSVSAADDLDGVKRMRAGDAQFASQHARIPMAVRGQYLVRPASQVHPDDFGGSGEKSSLRKKMQKLKQSKVL